MNQIALQLIESMENDLEAIRWNLMNDLKSATDDLNNIVFKAQELREMLYGETNQE